jgi:hypothetical protein
MGKYCYRRHRPALPDRGWLDRRRVKTDRVGQTDDLEAHIAEKKYDGQRERYVEAVNRLLGERPRTLIFLNVNRQVRVMNL